MGCCDVPKENNNKEKEIAQCPFCGTQGEKVRQKTVASLVSVNLEEKVTEEKYWLCKNKDCKVIYYNNDTEQIFTNEQVKVPIWFKSYAEPVYACYCRDVTKDSITDAVLNKGANSLEEIQNITGANTGNECITKNPRGKCCGGTVKQMLEEAKLLKQNQ